MTWLTREQIKSVRAAADELLAVKKLQFGQPSVEVVEILADVFVVADMLDMELDYREKAEEPLPTQEEVEEMCRQHGLKELPF